MINKLPEINRNASKIDLSNMNLKVFPPELFKCKNLKKLNLSNNQISNIPKEISEFARLENLDLSENKISVIYSKLFEIKNLKTLIINNNSIKRIPKQIANLKKLKKLSLAGNGIIELPKEISELSNLEQLNIANNLIIKFPYEVLELSSLTTLWISKNWFDYLPAKDIIANLKNLKKLYCYSAMLNNIDHLDVNYLSLTRKRGNSIFYLKSLADKIEAPFEKVGINNKYGGVNNLNVNDASMKSSYIDDNLNFKKHKIFISYSHFDKGWLKKIDPYLKGMQLEGLELDYWSDTRLKTGQKWKEEIIKALNEAHTAILLISQDFLASDFIQNNELPLILENAKEGGVKILPIILTYCRFTKIKILKDFQALNDPNTPLNTMKEHEIQEALLKLTYEIEESI